MGVSRKVSPEVRAVGPGKGFIDEVSLTLIMPTDIMPTDI